MSDIQVPPCDQCNKTSTNWVNPIVDATAKDGLAYYELGKLRSGCDDHPTRLEENETAEYWYDKLP